MEYTLTADNGREVRVTAQSVRVIEYPNGTRQVVFTMPNGYEDSYGGTAEWGQALPQDLIDAAGGVTNSEDL